MKNEDRKISELTIRSSSQHNRFKIRSFWDYVADYQKNYAVHYYRRSVNKNYYINIYCGEMRYD